ncbi:MAG: TIGR03032 family protein [Rhizomicrobium sp.]
MNIPDDAASATLHDGTGSFLALLDRFGCSLLLSTDDYRLVAIGVSERKPTLRALVLPFLRGVGVQGSYIAAGTASSVVVFKDVPGLAPLVPDAPQRFDAVYMPRAVHFTGRCDFHDMAFVGGAIVAVNTHYSCICAVDGRHSFTPLWKPPFITQLLPEDRCHLNGMAIENGQIRYATLLGESDRREGWRDIYLDDAGLVVEVPSGRIVASGLSLPHSPRVIGGRLFCLDSGRGELLGIDAGNGQRTVLARLPGFAHGLLEYRGVLFIAVSKLRSRRPERRLPLEDGGGEPICGILALDAASFRLLGTLEIRTGIHEIYDLQLLPGVRRADIRNSDQWREQQAIELPDSAFWAHEPIVR